MRPPPTMLARVMDTEWFKDARRRRIAFALTLAVLAIFCVWPRHYEAEADLKPVDNSGGLSAMLSQGGGLAGLGALLGSHDSIESDLVVARSQATLRNTLAKLSARERDRLGGGDRAQVKLRRKIDVAALRGSILQITATDGDPAFARDLVAACAAAIQERLTSLNLMQAQQRKAVAVNRVGETATRLAGAQSELTRFRATHKLAAPEMQLGAAVEVLASLQAKLEATNVELRTARQFATSDNIQVRALEAEASSLQSQIDAAQTGSRSGGAPTLGDMSDQSAEYINLYRNEKIAEALSLIYTEALEQITVDELSASANSNLIEPPFVRPELQYNILAVGLLLLVAMVAVACELYALAPPVGRR